MKISRRETYLAGITGAVVLLGATYWFGEPLVKEWGETLKTRARLAEEKKWSERVIERREEWSVQLKELRAQLPRYPADQPVIAELLKTIKTTADGSQLVLSRLEPDKEKVVGDLSEVAIDCTWDGGLDELVRFLYAMQTQGGILDIRQITITPAQGVPGRLKGNFTVFCAFSREKAAPAETPIPAS